MWYYEEEDLSFCFDPTDEEIIKDYLEPMIKNQLEYDFIVWKDVYAKEPWLLEHHAYPLFMENEWYYFATRTQFSDNKIGCGKQAKRKITGDKNGMDLGSWKANSKEDIVDSKTGKIIGIKNTLTFLNKSDNNRKKQKTGEGAYAFNHDPGSDSSWIMKEFMLVEGSKFQELVVCKIQELKKQNNKDNFHESCSSSEQKQEQIKNHDASSSEQKINGAHQHEEKESDWFQEFGLRVEEDTVIEGLSSTPNACSPIQQESSSSSEHQPTNESLRIESVEEDEEERDRMFETFVDWMVGVNESSSLTEEEKQNVFDNYVALCFSENS